MCFGNVVRKIHETGQKVWTRFLFAYRTVLHSATVFCPFFLDNGTDIKNVLGDNYSQAAYELFRSLQIAYQAAHESIRSKQESSKKRYDAKINVQSFVEGEWAYVWKPAPRDCNFKKIFDHFRGPFKIVKKLTDHLYKIEIANNKFYIVHMELMKSLFPREIPDQIRKDIDYDSGEDKSLVEPDFPDNRPLTEKKLTQTVNRDELLREHDETPLILVPPAIPFQPLQQERRYPSRNRVQHIPYQHTP